MPINRRDLIHMSLFLDLPSNYQSQFFPIEVEVRIEFTPPVRLFLGLIPANGPLLIALIYTSALWLIVKMLTCTLPCYCCRRIDFVLPQDGPRGWWEHLAGSSHYCRLFNCLFYGFLITLCSAVCGTNWQRHRRHNRPISQKERRLLIYISRYSILLAVWVNCLATEMCPKSLSDSLSEIRKCN